MRLAPVELADARLDIAAHIDDGEVGPEAERHRPAAERGSAEDGSRRQIGETDGRRRKEGVAKVLARQGGADGDPVRQKRRQILGGMDGDVDPAGEERLVDLLGEQALAAGLGERTVGDPVAGGADRHDRERRLIEAERRREAAPCLRGLGECERAAAGADPDCAGLQGASVRC